MCSDFMIRDLQFGLCRCGEGFLGDSSNCEGIETVIYLANVSLAWANQKWNMKVQQRDNLNRLNFSRVAHIYDFQ